MAELKRHPWLLPLFVLCLVLLWRPVLIWAQPAVEILAEPGFVADDGTWVLPYSLLGDAVVTGDQVGELNALRDGHPLLVREQMSYAWTQSQGPSTALAVLLDLPALRDEIFDTWTGEIEALLNPSARPGVLVSLAGCGPEGTEVLISGQMAKELAPVGELLQASPPGRLWDCVITALGALNTPDLPGRRVLLLVSDGREEIASRHVMASCVEAALRARVAVYVLSLAGKNAAETARLRELARRTGGRLLANEQVQAGDMAEILAWISAARGLRLEAEAVPLPAEITLQLEGEFGGLKVDVVGLGLVAARRVPQGSGWQRWLLMGGALLAAGGAGYLIWRQRMVVAGELLVRTKNGERRFPIPRHGVTIGRDADNSMVLNSRRVSRHHAVIRIKGDQVLITDLRSSGGTTVNGESVGTRCLAFGDRIMIGGSVEMKFKGRPAAN